MKSKGSSNRIQWAPFGIIVGMRIAWLTILTVTDLFANRLPFRVEEGLFQEQVILSGQVEPLYSETVRVRWFALIRRIAVSLGQEVKKGDLLAEVEVKHLEFRNQHLISWEKFSEERLAQAKIDEQYVLSQRNRLRSLASKDIISRAESETFEITMIEAALRRSRAEKELREARKRAEETIRQIRESNYFAPMDGVVTHLLVDPKQLMGSFMAMSNSKLARIDKPGTYRINATALDIQVSKLRVGQSGTAVLEGSGEKVPCQVVSLTETAAMAKEGMHFFEVALEFQKPGPMLPRGLLTRVELFVGPVRKTLQVPWNALGITPVKTTVSVAQTGEWVEREVLLGLHGRHRVEVLSGLKAGDVVVSELW